MGDWDREHPGSVKFIWYCMALCLEGCADSQLMSRYTHEFWGREKIDYKIIVIDSKMPVSALLPETNSQGDHAILYANNQMVWERMISSKCSTFHCSFCAEEMSPSAISKA